MRYLALIALLFLYSCTDRGYDIDEKPAKEDRNAFDNLLAKFDSDTTTVKVKDH